MCSLLSNTPPCPHACGSGDAQQRSVPDTHPSIHPLALTLSALNVEKHASLPAVVPVPGSRSSGSGPPATRKMADIPCQWQTRLSPCLSLSPGISRSISLSSFPLLPCSERSGAGRGLGVDRTGLGVLFGGEETSVKERKRAQGDKKAIRGQSSLTSRRNV